MFLGRQGGLQRSALLVGAPSGVHPGSPILREGQLPAEGRHGNRQAVLLRCCLSEQGITRIPQGRQRLGFAGLRMIREIVLHQRCRDLVQINDTGAQSGSKRTGQGSLAGTGRATNQDQRKHGAVSHRTRPTAVVRELSKRHMYIGVFYIRVFAAPLGI